MAVKFIIDSASDLLPSECKKLGVTHVPLTVRFGEKEFADAVDLSHKKFYKMLTSGKEEHPTTSQVTPAAWAAAMEEVVENGDTAVVITISSKLSGTYQSACIAAEEFEGKIFVVDSMTATIGERLLLQYGIRLAAEGLDAAAEALGIDTTEVESQSDADYSTNVNNLVSQGCDLTIGVGFLLEDAIQEAAEANTDTNFALIDSAFSDADFAPVELDNAKPILFNTA